MSLDILNPTILKKTKRVGGFTFVESSYIDNENFFAADASKSGFDKTSYVWTRLANCPQSKRWHSMAAWGDYIYSYAGAAGAPLTKNNDLYRYHIPTDTWSPSPILSVGTKRYKTCGDLAGEWFCIAGGATSTTDDTKKTRKITRFKISDPNNIIWDEYDKSGFTAVGDASAVGVDSVGTAGSLYVHGGYTGTTLSGQWRRWDNALLQWSTLSRSGNDPGAVEDTAMVQINDQYIYVHGGNVSITGTRKFNRYDIANNYWVRLTNSPSKKLEHFGEVFGRYIYLYGGKHNYFSGGTNVIWRYDTDFDIYNDDNSWGGTDVNYYTNDSFEVMTPSPFTSSEGASVKLGGYMYVQIGKQLWRYGAEVDNIEFAIERIY